MRSLLILASVAAAFVPTPGAVASMNVVLLDNTSQYSHNNGGEFRAVADDGLSSIVNWGAYAPSTSGTISSGIDGSSWGYRSTLNGQQYFQTFCIEYSEEFYPGTSYSVGFSQNAMYGGQPTGGDPISIGTAWLYSQFASGNLNYPAPANNPSYVYDYTFGSGRSATAGDLQAAIWWLEDESHGVRNSLIDLVESVLGRNDTTIKDNANGAYGVYALNLGAPGAVQDQLVIVVPEASTVIAGVLLLIPLGISTVRIVRGNHHKSQK
ncbi:hypothetical protein GC207_02315 [bacterium]|nr:hypothetical protein [bacterium]